MTAQITLTLDASGNLHAEAPGLNGARHKLSLVAGQTNYATLIANAREITEELETQAQRERNRERAIARDRHNSIVAYVAKHHPRSLRHFEPIKSSHFFTTTRQREAKPGRVEL
jgi:hypothetical protein